MNQTFARGLVASYLRSIAFDKTAFEWSYYGKLSHTEVILSEIGPDMSRFPSSGNLASWAAMCPGNNESAGKRFSGKTRKGSKWLRVNVDFLRDAADALDGLLG